MTIKCSIDRDSFQRFLADAFEVQESHLDPSSLSTLVQLQQLLAKRGPNTNETMQFIAERARTVAGADGAAIALLESSKLVYQAGSGTASSCVGRQVSAVLSPSGYSRKRSEILRVENAEADMRIQASVCRQFDAQSLLMLPIYKSKILTGVLQISFATAHKFAVSEIRAYGLIAALVEDVVSQKRSPEEMVDPHTTDTLLSRTDRERPQQQEICNDENPQLRSASLSFRRHEHGVLSNLAEVRFPGPNAITIDRPDGTTVLDDDWKRLAICAVLVLSIWSWLFYLKAGEISQDGNASSWRQSSVPKATDSLPRAGAKSDPRHPIQRSTVPKMTNTASKRIRVGLNEIDYVNDDVTIRHFLRNSTLRSESAPHNTINFADDVTIRYFDSKPAATIPTTATVAKTGRIRDVSVVSK